MKERKTIKKKQEPIWALYKGDEYLAMGTKKELAEMLGVSENTVYFYSTPSYAKRNYINGWVTLKVEELDLLVKSWREGE